MAQAVKLANGLRRTAVWSERILAIAIFAGMAVFFLHSLAALSVTDWNQTETLYELINRILLLVICLELIRTLLTHELEAVLELLAFVVARKTLKPDLSVVDILLSVIAFVILMIARKYLVFPADSENSLETPKPQNNR